ncbi:hypothetical protein KUCAC02_021618, partial [Chaenocephalus aceratus]
VIMPPRLELPAAPNSLTENRYEQVEQKPTLTTPRVLSHFALVAFWFTSPRSPRSGGRYHDSNEEGNPCG